MDGYHGDLNETFFVGNVEEKYIKLVEAAYLSMKNAIDASNPTFSMLIVKPGMKVKEIGGYIQDVVDKYGFSIDKKYCGHGIGQMFHSNPTIHHYRK